jgi:parallel beta-helix repeat protein
MRSGALVLLVVGMLAAAPYARADDCGGSIPCRCGDTVVGTARLSADLGPCDGDGLQLRGRAVLDCAGHLLEGHPRPASRTDEVPDSHGIVFDNTTGAAVRNCRVTGFTYGIQLSGARDSEVVGSEVFRNGDHTTKVGYGIHVSHSQRNTIRDCKLHDNADEGIHIGTDSDANTVVGNEAWSNGRENFYILSARGNRLLRNQGRGEVSANLYVKHGVDNVVEGNRFAERPVVVRGRSRGNTFTDNLFGGGLKLEAYEEPHNAPANNLVRGGRLAGGVCLELTEAHDNRLEDVSLEGCKGIAARAIRSATNHLLGMDVAGVRLDLAGGATLRLLSPIRVEARTASGRPVIGARIEVRDATGEVQPSPATDRGGAAHCLVPTHRINAAGLIPLTPVALTLRADGFADTRTVLTDPLAKTVSVTLESDGPPRPSKRRTPQVPGRSKVRPISVP